MAEWLKAAVLKTAELFIGFRGFESHSLRQYNSLSIKVLCVMYFVIILLSLHRNYLPEIFALGDSEKVFKDAAEAKGESQSDY